MLRRVRSGSIILKCRLNVLEWAALTSRQFTPQGTSVFLTGRDILIEYRQATLVRIALDQQRRIFGVDGGANLGRQRGRSLWLSFLGRGGGGHGTARLRGSYSTRRRPGYSVGRICEDWPLRQRRSPCWGMGWRGSARPSAFIAGCLLCGSGFGVLLNVTNRLVAVSSAPQRGYAIVQLVEVLFCIGFYLGVPLITERFGTLSVFAALAALCAGVFLLLAGVPVGAPRRLESRRSGRRLRQYPETPRRVETERHPA